MNNLCPVCLSGPGSHVSNIKDTIANVVCETDVCCTECESLVDYCAYGNWESECCGPPNSLWFNLRHNKRCYIRRWWEIASKRDLFRWIYVIFSGTPLKIDSE